MGNPLREDDGAAHLLAQRLPPWEGWDTKTVTQLTPELAAEFPRYDRVILADADAGVQQATLELLLPTATAPGSGLHATAPAELATLAQALYGFRGEVLLCRLPAVTFGYRESLSPQARAGVKAALALLAKFAPPSHFQI